MAVARSDDGSGNLTRKRTPRKTLGAEAPSPPGGSVATAPPPPMPQQQPQPAAVPRPPRPETAAA